MFVVTMMIFNAVVNPLWLPMNCSDKAMQRLSLLLALALAPAILGNDLERARILVFLPGLVGRERADKLEPTFILGLLHFVAHHLYDFDDLVIS